MTVRNLKPIHPGRVLATVLMADNNMDATTLASETGFDQAYVESVVAGKEDVTVKFSCALEDVFGLPSYVWLRMQIEYDRRKRNG